MAYLIYLMQCSFGNFIFMKSMLYIHSELQNYMYTFQVVIFKKIYKFSKVTPASYKLWLIHLEYIDFRDLIINLQYSSFPRCKILYSPSKQKSSPWGFKLNINLIRIFGVIGFPEFSSKNSILRFLFSSTPKNISVTYQK